MNLFVVIGDELATPPLAGSHPARHHPRHGADAGARLGPATSTSARSPSTRSSRPIARARCARSSARAPPRSSRASASWATPTGTLTINNGEVGPVAKRLYDGDHVDPVRHGAGHAQLADFLRLRRAEGRTTADALPVTGVTTQSRRVSELADCAVLRATHRLRRSPRTRNATRAVPHGQNEKAGAEVDAGAAALARARRRGGAGTPSRWRTRRRRSPASSRRRPAAGRAFHTAPRSTKTATPVLATRSGDENGSRSSIDPETMLSPTSLPVLKPRTDDGPPSSHCS